MNPIDAISASVINRLKAAQSARVAANSAARPLAATDSNASPATKSAQAPLAPAVSSRVLAGAEAPVDTDRVTMIRKAIENGSYPVMPARIADAMIAAGYLLRTPK